MSFAETISLLRAQHSRACKTITSEGSRSYPNIKHWFYEPVLIAGLDDFAALLSKIETDDRAVIIRGRPKRDVQIGSLVLRRKAVFESRPLRLVCFDIDKLEAPKGMSPISNEAIEFTVRQLPLPFHTASCVAQFSANAGRKGQTIKLHLWFLLENAQSDRAMRAWAASTNGLIDPALFNAVQPHYTANPRFEGGALDPFNGDSRVRHIRKASEIVEFEPPPTAVAGVTAEFFAASEIVTDDEGKAVDGREALLRDIRWKILNASKRPLTYDDFLSRVWEDFVKRAVLGATSQSSNRYDFERVADSCAADWEKHGRIIPVSSNSKISLEEAEALVRKGVGDVIAGGQIAIKVTPGVGKSTIAAKELASLAAKNVEIYAPTNSQQQEWEERTGGKTILGRNAKTCRKHEEVKVLQRIGIAADTALCRGTLGTAGKCQYFDSCPYQAQFRDPGPGVRIYSHAHLTTPRHKALPQPDIVVIDEGFWNSAVEEEKFCLSDLYAVAARVSDRWKQNQNSVERDATLQTVASVIRALKAPCSMLGCLRDSEITADSLRDAAKLISKNTPRLALKAGESIAALKARAKLRQRSSFVLVTRLFRALARELETSRRDVHCIVPSGEGFLFCRRQTLARLEGVERILLLDADLERDNVKPFLPAIEFREIECAQNLRIEQVSDLSFSRSWLGLRDECPNTECVGELCTRIRPLLTQCPLIVSYKGLIPHLRELLPARCRFAHFGALRGTNAYENCDSVFVIGRQFLSTTAIEAQARALHYDAEQLLNFETATHWHAAAPDTALPSIDYADGRVQALMAAQREAETRQAVGRLRAVRSLMTKKAYLFSNQPVAGLVPHRLVPFESSKAERIFSYLGGWLPLNPKLLVKFAGGYFPKGEKQALKWRDTISLPQSTINIPVERWGSEICVLTYGRDRSARGGPKFRILVNPLLHPYPEHSLSAKADLVVDPLPWAVAPRSALPEELKIPGFEVVCLKDQLPKNIVKWAHRSARARGEKPVCPAAPIPTLPIERRITPTMCPAGGSFAIAA